MRRIQRKRVKGWHVPDNAVYVGRPNKWGNPFRVGVHGDSQQCVDLYRRYLDGEISDEDTKWRNSLYDEGLWCSPMLGKILVWTSSLDALRGKDLCCWCPLDQPCHADVLLELANSPHRECDII